MPEKGNYIPWESRFRRILDNKLDDGDSMWNSIQNGPYKRPMITNPDNDQEEILEPLSKMIAGNKKQYIADVKVMNYLLQAIPNDICNSVDASKEGESLESVYERLTTLVNIMDRNNVRSIPVGVTRGFSRRQLTTAMMLLARAITQKFSTPTNNRLRTSSNIRNQAVVQDGRVDIQTKNAGYGENSNRNVGKQNRNQAFNAGNGYDDSNQMSSKPKVRDAKYFREQMLLAMKDESGSNLNDEENDFLLDNSYRDETMEELTVAVIEVIQLVLWIVDSGCSKRMTGNLQLLKNFVKKFKGLVRFKNDHFTAITGYGDYVQDEAPDMIIDFINQVQRNLKAQILTIQTDNGTEFNNEKLRAFYAKLGIVHKTSIARAPQQKGIVKRRNRTLVEAARTILISGTFNHYPSRKPRKL
nr:ribonuclease H-like domain-containing protein [Tanacetum cinerariifolium]